MSIKLQLPRLVDVKPRLTVIGVGGAGCNAVNNMIAAGLQGVEFVVANTDAQSLAASSAEHRIQLGANLTEGLGAGSRPEIGEAAAEEALDEVRAHVAGSHMVFIAAGMGGGTGTGAAAVIARTARDLGILTVGIVCKPFQFEGARRMRIADAGVQSLRQHVDTLIVIPNQNLFRIANERTTFAEAFVLADQVLYSGVACIVELVLKEGLINLDFADVRTVMSGMGTAMMGTGEATGERRAILAAEEAIANPLLDEVTLKGAKGLLLSITGGRDMTLYEVDEAASRVRQEVDPDANIIVGATFDDNLGDRLRVSIVASGMGRAADPASQHAAPVSFPQAATAPVFAPSPLNGHSMPGHALPGHPINTLPHHATQPSPQYPQAGHQQFQHPQHQQHHGAAPVMSAPSDAMQRRLSEVLQSAQGPIQAEIAAAYPPVRSQWTAPNNVSIEEGFANIGVGMRGASNAGQRPVAFAAPVTAPSQHGFMAQPPVEAPRASRRIPAVDEFPAVGQREWHAKNASASAVQERAIEERRKAGFFGRLTGLVRKSSHAQTTGSDAISDSHGAADDASLPVLFGRERR